MSEALDSVEKWHLSDAVSITAHPQTAREIIDHAETTNINPMFQGFLVLTDVLVPVGCAVWKYNEGAVVAISNLKATYMIPPGMDPREFLQRQ